MTVTQGRRRLVPADSISEYVQLLLREAGVMMVARRSRGEGSLFWNESVSGGSVSFRRAMQPTGNVARPG